MDLLQCCSLLAVIGNCIYGFWVCMRLHVHWHLAVLLYKEFVKLMIGFWHNHAACMCGHALFPTNFEDS